jgi:RHS repeat-associated protein
MLFDSEFKLVPGSSGMLKVNNNANMLQTLSQLNIEMEKSGYFYAYLANESPMNVYFDDFQVSHIPGPVLEQNHYYPFGMLNPQLTTQSITKPLNFYNYNGKELQKDLNLGWLDYGARFYDGVLGRWHSVDPSSQKYCSMSLYNYGFNSPINVIDPDGRDCVITIERDKNGDIFSLKISSTIYITGAGANQDRADNLNKSVGSTFGSDDVKSNVNVSFDINYKYDANKSQKDLKGGENILEFVNEASTAKDRSNVPAQILSFSNGTSLITAGNYGIIKRDDWDDRSAVYHETGHLMGLVDRYAENSQASYPYFDKDLMGAHPSQYPILGDAHYQAFFFNATAYSIMNPGSNDTKTFINRFKVDRSLKGYPYPATPKQMITNPYPATPKQMITNPF